MTLLRTHRHWLMVVIAVLALPFFVYFVKTDYGRLGSDKIGRIYDRSISQVEVDRGGRMLGLAAGLGMDEFAREMTLGARKQDREEFNRYFTSNLLIVRHEADALGIRPAQSEVVEVVRNFPAFQ